MASKNKTTPRRKDESLLNGGDIKETGKGLLTPSHAFSKLQSMTKGSARGDNAAMWDNASKELKAKVKDKVESIQADVESGKPTLKWGETRNACAKLFDELKKAMPEPPSRSKLAYDELLKSAEDMTGKELEELEELLKGFSVKSFKDKLKAKEEAQDVLKATLMNAGYTDKQATLIATGKAKVTKKKG